MMISSNERFPHLVAVVVVDGRATLNPISKVYVTIIRSTNISEVGRYVVPCNRKPRMPVGSHNSYSLSISDQSCANIS